MIVFWIVLVVWSAALLRGAVALIYSYTNRDKTKVLAPTHDPEFGIYNGHVCLTWDINRIERELGGTDFTLCENKECPGCYPADIAKIGTALSNYAKSICPACGERLPTRGACKTCLIEWERVKARTRTVVHRDTDWDCPGCDERPERPDSGIELRVPKGYRLTDARP